jgi:hypothetical protein
MSTPDFRALCAELVEAWDATADFDFNDFGHAAVDIVTRARAALATEPVGEGPTDEQLLESAAKALGYKSIPSDETCLTAEASELLDFARAILARWGHPATPPAPEPGEVAELVDSLQCEARAEEVLGNCALVTSAELRRAATLLQQLSAPTPAVVPVAVSERLPGEGDCDAEGRCWLLTSGVMVHASHTSHWLPASGIPLPQGGEVQP